MKQLRKKTAQSRGKDSDAPGRDAAGKTGTEHSEISAPPPWTDDDGGFSAGIFDVDDRPSAAPPRPAAVQVLPNEPASQSIVMDTTVAPPTPSVVEEATESAAGRPDAGVATADLTARQRASEAAAAADAPADTKETTSRDDERRRGRGRRRSRGRGGKSSAEKRSADSASTPASQRDAASAGASAGRREMLINCTDPDEVRIAILNDGRLDELYIERASAVSNVGNVYKGRVTNIESSIQAAFVDFGRPVHGFLHISDLHPSYFPDSKGEPELVGRKTPRRHRPPIQQCLKRGQEVIVQVIKEGVGTKGPTLSTYLSIPGRFLVMMPGMDQLGVSRKIEDDEQRRKAREILAQLSLPKDTGFIVRTAGIDRNKRELQRDLNYLTRLWDRVQRRIKKEPAPAVLYKESDLVIRTVRDLYDTSLNRMVVDNPVIANRAKEFLRVASPRAHDVVEVYDGAEPLFHRFGIESEIDKLYSRQVPLPCGGSIVIESTEAMVAIDVNSGRFRVPENAEETAYRVNLEAADEIARQLRLRDLGGLVVCDFIDMTQERHRRQVEKRLSDALKKHKERVKLLRISRFGLLEMTRQRQRPSFAKSLFQDCPRCSGSGRVRAPESVGLDVMRRIRLASHREGVASIDVRLATAVANDLLNRKRLQIADLERSFGQTIRIHADPNMAVENVVVSCTDRRGREVPATAPLVASPARPSPASIAHPSPSTSASVSAQAGQQKPPPARPSEAAARAATAVEQGASATSDASQKNPDQPPKKKRGRSRRRRGR